MSKYIKKPIIIDAFEYGIEEEPEWFVDKVKSGDIIKHIGGTNMPYEEAKQEYYCEIKTFEGIMRGNVNDFIILGIKGECYPCKPDIFKQTYSLYC